jgi:putative transport protein
VSDWTEKDHTLVTRRIVITNSKITGKTLKDLRLRSAFGVSVTRVIRSGVELVANPTLYLQVGDGLMCVGTQENIEQVSAKVGNSNDALNKPNLVPIFLGIVVGVIFGSIPFRFPGIPQAIKLGLAGGPLIIAILLGHWGPKFKITTYTTASANLMIREIGISLFLAAVGIGAGGEFWSSIVGGGYWWILYGACITMIPLCITFVVARLLKLNFYQICGLISGSCTNPPVLAFAQGLYGSDYTSVNYATVYPLSMFLRVLAAQLLILIAMA